MQGHEQPDLSFTDPHGNEYRGAWIGANLAQITWYIFDQPDERMPGSEHVRAILGTRLEASIVTLSEWTNHGRDGGWFTTLGARTGEGEILIIGTIPDHLRFPGISTREVRDVETLCAALQSPTFTKVIVGDTRAMPFPNTRYRVWFWSLACGLGAAGFPTVCIVSHDDVRFVRRSPYRNDPGWERALCAATDHLEEWVPGSNSSRQTRPDSEEEWDRVANEAFETYAAAHPKPTPEGIRGLWSSEIVTETEVVLALTA